MYCILIYYTVQTIESNQTNNTHTFINVNVNVFVYVIPMVRSDSSMLKTSRLTQIRKEMLMRIKDGLLKEKFLDWIELNIGLSRPKAQEYVSLIVRTEGWHETEDTVFFCVDDLPAQ